MRVSFILPAYKRRFLREAIASILGQTCHELELVVVDDCSPEDLKSVVDEFHDERLSYHRNPENLGGRDLVAAWNHAMQYARGEWCVLASDDDVWYPQCLERLLELTEKYPACDLFHARCTTIDADGKRLDDAPPRCEFESQIRMVYERGVRHAREQVPDFMFRLSAWKRIGGFVSFPLAWYSDDATMMLLAKNGCAHTAEILFGWRLSGLNLSSDQDRLLKGKLDAAVRFLAWMHGVGGELVPANDEERGMVSQLEEGVLRAVKTLSLWLLSQTKSEAVWQEGLRHPLFDDADREAAKSTRARESRARRFEQLPSRSARDPRAQSKGEHMSYSLTEKAALANFSVLPPAANEGTVRPTLGSEIGPDPRNATAKVHIPGIPTMDAGNGVRYDFLQGFRVKAPDVPGEYEIVVWNLDTGVELFRSAMPPSSLAVGSRKYFIRYRFELADRVHGRLLARVDYDCTDKDVLITVPDGGLGDNIAWLPYAEQFRVTHGARVTCACGEWLIRLVRDQYPELKFIPVGEQPNAENFYAAYFCAVFGKDRLDWRPRPHQHLGMQGSVAAILGVPFEPLKVRFRLDAPRTVKEPYVVISAMASNPCKHWNWPDGWNLLCRYLKRLGYRVFVIDRDREQNFAGNRFTVPSEAEDMTGAKPIAERIALLQHADFFVGLPSGLSWLAWCCNVPVVMISGFTIDGSEFPTPYRVFNPDFCHGCWNDTDCFFDTQAPVWCPHHAGTSQVIECTRVITPKMVFDTVNRIPCVAQRLAAKRQERPRLSVIMPVTRGKYLRRAVESTVAAFAKFGQTEILLLNDGSKEPGLDTLLDALASENPDVVTVFHETENRGAAQARNFLVEHSSGEYLVFFDDDDVMLPFDVGRGVAFLDAHPDCEVDYAPKYVFDDEHGYLHEIHGSEWSDFAAFFAPQVNLSVMFIRRTAFEAVDGFKDVKGDPHAGLEDVYLFLRLAERREFHFDPEPRSLYRVHQNRLSTTTPSWYDWSTEQICARHPEIVERIKQGDMQNLVDAAPVDAIVSIASNKDGEIHSDAFETNASTRVAACGRDCLNRVKAVNETPLLVRRLMGAVAYLHQREPEVWRPIFEKALKEFPEDPGIPGVYMTLLRSVREYDRLGAYADEALKLFADSPKQQCLILGALLTSYRDRGLAAPEGLEERLRAAHARWTALPEEMDWFRK